MRAGSRPGTCTGAVFAAFWTLIALAAGGCEGGGAGGPGVEPPWKDDTSGRVNTGGTGGAAMAGQGGAGAAGSPGAAGSADTQDGAGGTTPSPAGEGGSSYVGGSGGSGVSGESGTGISGAGGTGVAGGGGSALEPEATAGCRGPLQDGCTVCCEPTTSAGGDESCTQKSASTGSDWYNSVESLAGPCPTDCQACAQCSFRDEEEFAQLEARPDCACDTIDIGIDPCFAPTSCECYCQTYNALEEVCPHLAQ